MDVYELVERVGGEITCGRAMLRQGSTYIRLGQLNGNNMEFTEEGRAMAEKLEADSEAPKKRGRPAGIRAVVVESPSVVVDDALTTAISTLDD
jgi:hypothetical protein